MLRVDVEELTTVRWEGCLRYMDGLQLIMLNALPKYFYQPLPKLYWASMWLALCCENVSLVLNPFSLYNLFGPADVVFVVSVFLWIRHDPKRSSVSGIFDLGLLAAVYWALVVPFHIASSRGWFSLLKYSFMYALLAFVTAAALVSLGAAGLQ